jgi:nucleotide-binding universal stress UspA family protein
MRKIQKILVAVDFSEQSLPTVHYAAKLSHDLNASIVLVNILDHRIAEPSLWPYTFDLCQKSIDEQIADRESGLSDLAQKAEASTMVIKQIVRSDVPYRGLLKTIEEEKPDLLIMGTKGRGALADTIVGSCAQKMFRRCPIPLLSIRPS